MKNINNYSHLNLNLPFEIITLEEYKHLMSSIPILYRLESIQLYTEIFVVIREQIRAKYKPFKILI